MPLLVAGGGERTTLRLVAQYADASNLVAAKWGGGAFTLADVQRKYALLQQHCEALGRPYPAVLRTFGNSRFCYSEAAILCKKSLWESEI